MTTERSFDRGGIELPQDATDRRVIPADSNIDP
jgi:hypothetical protein